MQRKEPLINNQIYHIYNRSIAGYKIFNMEPEYLRMVKMIRYYHVKDVPFKFSEYIRLKEVERNGFTKHFLGTFRDKEKHIQIICYCLMPTHLHLVLKQLKKNGISIFTGNLLNSYSKYFNTKHRRKGPLWEGKFNNVLVETDEQLIHLTRYIHLNPVTEEIVKKPEFWAYSSYNEYLLNITNDEGICEYENVLDISSTYYKKFVNDHVSYQRDLAKIKHLLLE